MTKSISAAAARLARLGCTPAQIAKHIEQLTLKQAQKQKALRPKLKPKKAVRCAGTTMP